MTDLFQPAEDDIRSQGEVDACDGHAVRRFPCHCGIDPDNSFLLVQQRSSGISPVDRCVHLENSFSFHTPKIVDASTDNTGSQRPERSLFRMPDCQNRCSGLDIPGRGE